MTTENKIESLQEKIKDLQQLVEFWSNLADMRRIQRDIACDTLRSISRYSEHAGGDCCGALSDVALQQIEELEDWTTFFKRKNEWTIYLEQRKAEGK